jgi:hypothetical protein
MKTFITFFVIVLALSSISLGVDYGKYEFTGTSTGDNQFNAVTTQPYFGTFSNFTRTGVTWVAGPNVFNSSGWGIAKDDNKYVRFTLTLTPPYNFNGTSLILWLDNYGPGSISRLCEVMYRYDTNSFANAGYFVPNNYILAPTAAVIPAAPLGATFLEIRLYAWGLSSSLTLDNVRLTGDEPLPVELSSFTASIINKHVVLNWQTATETDNFGFDVERRTLNKDWEKISFVSGNGNSNSPKAYSFTDKTAFNGKNIYRLKQIDANGNYTYSKQVEVDLGLPATYSLEQNYPNPFNPATIISYQIPVQSAVKIDVLNSIGEMVATLVNEVKESGYYDVEFNAASLSSGVYFYRISTDNFICVKKMMMVK